MCDLTEEKSISIGRPIANTQVLILDKDGDLQPIGVAGELYISGEGLARGYLNRPELTAEKFILNALKPGGRMYRTGDLARWLPDGNIEYLGRMDSQVKIRGFSIELGEIEAQLLKHPNIKETVVIAIEKQERAKTLCAYFVASEKLEAYEIRELLSKELPDYMIPSYYVQLDKIPLTTNGKIDKKKLLEWDITINTETEYVAPQNEIEKELEEMWKQLLKISKLSIYDNSFEVGGNSIDAIQLAERILKIGASVKVSDIYEYPTVNSMASYIRDNFSEQVRLPAHDIKIEEKPLQASDVKIISGIVENKDKYPWEQLGCFYRPFAILFESFSMGYFDIFLFYTSYYNSFSADGQFSNIFEEDKTCKQSFFNFYENVLKDRLGLYINLIEFWTEEEMHLKIREELDSGAPVLVPIDLIELSYNQGYKQESHMHFFIMKGYNNSKEIYYILDNMHLEGGSSTIYKDFTLKYKDLYGMMQAYFKNFYPNMEKYQMWSLNAKSDR